MSDYIEVANDGGICRLTLNRPEKRNALKREIIESLLSEVSALASDASLRVVVLQATGKAFCAGMDLGEMQDRAESPAAKNEWRHDSEVYCKLIGELHSLSVPTIAAVQGPALAGGMGLVLACDIVLASENAFFMLPEPMRGITAAMVTPLLVHRIGTGPATYMLLSNERVSAVDARRFGLCHDVVGQDELSVRVDAAVRAILSGSPSALAITKRHIDTCSDRNLKELLTRSVSVSAESRETNDAREGLAAFLENRKPKWQVAP